MIEILLILIFMALIFGPATLDILLWAFIIVFILSVIAGVLFAIGIGVYYLFTL